MRHILLALILAIYPLNQQAQILDAITTTHASSSPSTTQWTTGVTTGTAQTSPQHALAYSFTVSGSNITMTAICRYKTTGDSHTHTLRVVGPVGTWNQLGSVSVDMATGVPDANGLICEDLGSPVTLSSGSTYAIVSCDEINGDTWYNYDASVTVTSDATYAMPDGTFYILNSGVSADPIDPMDISAILNYGPLTAMPMGFKYHF